MPLGWWDWQSSGLSMAGSGMPWIQHEFEKHRAVMSVGVCHLGLGYRSVPTHDCEFMTAPEPPGTPI